MYMYIEYMQTHMHTHTHMHNICFKNDNMTKTHFQYYQIDYYDDNDSNVTFLC